VLDDYEASSRRKAEGDLFVQPRDAGRRTARSWLAAHYGAIGMRGTLDLQSALPRRGQSRKRQTVDRLTPLPRSSVSEDEYDGVEYDGLLVLICALDAGGCPTTQRVPLTPPARHANTTESNICGLTSE
jgi:hypothetical protein